MMTIILSLILINGGGGGGGGGLPTVGDTMTVWVNEFKLILGRHPELAQVRAVTDNAYILSKYEELPIVSLYTYRDLIIASSLEGTNYYTLDGGESWSSMGFEIPSPSRYPAVDSLQTRRGRWNLILFYGSYDAVYFVLGLSGSPREVSNVGMGQVFDLAYTKTGDFIDSVTLYLGTENGVVQAEASISVPRWRFTQLGDLSDSVISIAYLDGTVFAGLPNGVKYWDGSQWNDLADVTGRIYDIESYGDKVLIASSDGLFLYENGTVTLLLDGNCIDVAFLDDVNYGVIKDTLCLLTNDGGNTWEPQEDVGKTYSITASYSLGTYFVGVTQGVEMLTDEGWLNVSSGMGNLLSDRDLAAVIEAVESEPRFDDSLLSFLGISQEDLYDVDGDPKIYIYITPLEKSGDVSVSEIYGYFDPTDEDSAAEGSNVKEIIVLNLDKIDFSDVSTIKKRIAYFYAKYVAWSLDNDDYIWHTAGLAALGAYLATGLDYENGLDDTCEFVANPNQYLFHYPLDWRPTPVVADGDIERVFLWYEYMYERFGSDFVRALFSDPANGLTSLEVQIRIFGHGLEVDDVIDDWFIASYLDNPDTNFYGGKYGYRNIDIQVVPSVFVPEGHDYSILPYGLVIVRTTNDDTVGVPFVFNGVDNAPFHLWGIRSTESSVVVQSESLDAKNRFRTVVQPGEEYAVAVVFHALSIASFYISSDTTAPEGEALYALQNPLLPHVLDVYFLIEGEPVYSDVVISMPTLIVESDGDTETYYMDLYANNESYIYMTNITLDVPGGTEKSFTLKVLYQDLSGNETVGHDVTVHVRRIGEEGAVIVLDNGNCTVVIPEGAVTGSVPLAFSTLQSDGDFISASSSGASNLYSVGSPYITLVKPVEIRIKLGSASNGAGLAIFRWSNGTWTPLPTTYDPSENVLIASSDRFGVFQVRKGQPAVSVTPEFTINKTVLHATDHLSLSYTLPSLTDIKVAVYDYTGRMVKNVFEGKPNSLRGEIRWNLEDEYGAKVSSGIYFLTLEGENIHKTYKIVVIK
ncbi:MAG: hypothetical protein DRQ10_01870 [Candidatus Hydrothermota bacterium]|nr:MAG: hypothetical protein DRQ10_01870 [Candidatus Hydrothermae bacterium]